MTKEEELQHQKELLEQELEYINVRKIVTSMRCPICGHPLHGYVTAPAYDTCEVTPHIVCTSGCKLLHYTGHAMSLYGYQVGGNGKHITKAYVLQSAISAVRVWVKHFGSPLEENY